MLSRRVLFFVVALGGLAIPLATSAQTTFCQTSPPVPIPDNNPGGVSDFINFTDSITIDDTQVLVQITHTFIGDLDIDVTSPGGTTVRVHAEDLGGSDNNMNVTYSDSGILNQPPYTCGCLMQPSGPGVMADFNGEDSQGNWEIFVVDNAGGDTGTIDNWCVSAFGTGVTPPITNLFCTDPIGTGTVEMTWNNGAAYDSINIYVNGGLEMSIGGGSTSYTTLPQATGQTIEVCVEGVIGGTPSDQVCCMVFLEPDPGTPVQFCSNTTPVAIPDNDPTGISDSLDFTDSVIINDTEVLVQITHTFIGDLEVDVTSPGGTTVTLHDELGGSDNDIDIEFRDSGLPNGTVPYDCACEMQPSGPGTMADFDGENAQGMWDLAVADVGGGSTGTLDNWCVTAFGNLGPDNDDCADAIAIGDGATPFDTTFATTDGDIPCSTQDTLDVWFLYTASCTGLMNANTCDTTVAIDTALAIWEGTDCATITSGGGTDLGCNDDSCGPAPGFASNANAAVVAGNQYLVQVSGWGGTGYSGTLTVSCAMAPDNDLCGDRFPIAEGETAYSNDNATTDGPSPCGALGADVWYTYTALCDTTVTVTTCNDADYDTALAAYPGGVCPPDIASVIACNDDDGPGGCGLTSTITFAVSAGEEYLIQVGGFNGNMGSGTLTLSVDPACGNDFIRGDMNADATLNPLVEALFILAFGFLGGPPPPCTEAADADSSGDLNPLVEALFILSFGFTGGPPPPPPFPDCGADPDPGSSLGCDFSACP